MIHQIISILEKIKINRCDRVTGWLLELESLRKAVGRDDIYLNDKNDKYA